MSDRDLLKESFTATPDCLTPEQLEALLDGKKGHPHLESCPRCQAELAMLKSFESDVPLPDEGAAVAWISAQLDRRLDSIKQPVRSRARAAVQGLEPQNWLSRMLGRGGFRWALPIGAVAAVAIVSALLLQESKPPQLQANAGGNQVIYRSQEVVIVGPVGELQQVPRELQWQSFSGASMYRIEIMEVDQTRLWAGDTKETFIPLPAAVRAKMLPGKPILWQVTATDAQGRVLGSSQTQRFSTPRQNSSEKSQSSH
jgi:hypothetical protein